MDTALLTPAATETSLPSATCLNSGAASSITRVSIEWMTAVEQSATSSLQNKRSGWERGGDRVVTDVPSVYKVTHKHVVGVWQIAADPEQFHQVVMLTMDITFHSIADPRHRRTLACNRKRCVFGTLLHITRFCQALNTCNTRRPNAVELAALLACCPLCERGTTRTWGCTWHLSLV